MVPHCSYPTRATSQFLGLIARGLHLRKMFPSLAPPSTPTHTCGNQTGGDLQTFVKSDESLSGFLGVRQLSAASRSLILVLVLFSAAAAVVSAPHCGDPVLFCRCLLDVETGFCKGAARSAMDFNFTKTFPSTDFEYPPNHKKVKIDISMVLSSCTKCYYIIIVIFVKFITHPNYEVT